MNKDFFIKQINNILKDFDIIKSKSINGNLGDIPFEEIMYVLTKAKAAIERITGDKSEYYKDIEAILKKTYIWEGDKLIQIIGTVTALKSDLQNNYLESLNDIIRSEVFSDFIEMAEHLLIEGYKDPAAVLIGSTLESHLRELCKTIGINIEVANSKGNLVPKKADLMNSDLTKAKIYSSAYQKQIVAWLSIRNSAAHGHYSDYSNEEINLMLQGVRQFILSTKQNI